MQDRVVIFDCGGFGDGLSNGII